MMESSLSTTSASKISASVLQLINTQCEYLQIQFSQNLNLDAIEKKCKNV